ncbi:MAG: hypothetical protein C0485_01275 [Pirellula sp.]|nr:hypothetical protein [Pirellula sp.]
MSRRNHSSFPWHFLRALQLFAALLAALIPTAFDDSSALAAAANPPRFTIHLLGFEDAVHTAPWGYQSSRVSGIHSDGVSSTGLIGTSSRYHPAGVNAGESAWRFDVESKSLQQLGLLSPEYYIGYTQHHRSEPWLVSESGPVVGVTSTNPTSSSGENLAWYFDPSNGSTKRIGYSAISGSPNPHGDAPLFMQDDGFVAGISSTSNYGGEHAWVYDPTVGVTRQIGLPANTNLGPTNGELYHWIEGVSDDNLVVGTSKRPSIHTGNVSGPAVWVYSPQTDQTTRIGLFNGAYLYPDGHQESRYVAMNSQGFVTGYSYFRGDGTHVGKAWIYDPAANATIPLGYADPANGAAWSDWAGDLTSENRVYGVSTSNVTTRPWVYNHADGTTTPLGLTDGAHLLPNGGSDNTVVDHTASGFVLGHAKRGVGDTHSTYNRTAWVYDPSTGQTRAAGLTTANFTTPSGGRWSSAFQINESGQAVGSSRLFHQGLPYVITRDSAWFYDPTTGESFELAKDLAISRKTIWNGPRAINNVGQVVGISSNNSGLGDFVWLYDHRTKSFASDFDIRNAFTVRPSGGADIYVHELTETGLVLGESARRATNGSDAGKTMWLYDSNVNKTHDLTFSVKSDGEAYTDVLHLADDGTMFGEYDAYDGNVYEGRRYFYWSILHGFHDLESLVVGDMQGLGWGDLVRGQGFNEKLRFVNDSLLFGYGLRLNGNSIQFALVKIPEPASAIMLLASAVVGCASFRRRANWTCIRVITV